MLELLTFRPVPLPGLRPAPGRLPPRGFIIGFLAGKKGLPIRIPGTRRRKSLRRIGGKTLRFLDQALDALRESLSPAGLADTALSRRSGMSIGFVSFVWQIFYHVGKNRGVLARLVFHPRKETRVLVVTLGLREVTFEA